MFTVDSDGVCRYVERLLTRQQLRTHTPVKTFTQISIFDTRQRLAQRERESYEVLVLDGNLPRPNLN